MEIPRDHSKPKEAALPLFDPKKTSVRVWLLQVKNLFALHLPCKADITRFIFVRCTGDAASWASGIDLERVANHPNRFASMLLEQFEAIREIEDLSVENLVAHDDENLLLGRR